jgi:hypothetical protein
MSSYGFFIKPKYVFDVSKNWHPYVGVGVGNVEISDELNAPIDHGTKGSAVQGVVGMQWRGDPVGVRLEYMGLRAKLDDDTGDKVNASARGILLGVTFNFLHR